eukprot:TRINITY_DN20983_c0_g4_i1.p1 TRINITY_DN20983_c0_g4~~TRINITY_DN20983_c0_g4_i1.p1  ORF type:complete len:438 (+),score=100.25 TRINITY_DN20983_c0_g4_i1:2-1315(+)
MGSAASVSQVLSYVGKKSVNSKKSKKNNAQTLQTFTTHSGTVTYDPEKLLDTRLGPSLKDSCMYKASCTIAKCPLGHDFPCKSGVQCPKMETCKFVHPDPASVNEGRTNQNGNTDKKKKQPKVCPFGTACKKKCSDAHPLGRVSVKFRDRAFYYDADTTSSKKTKVPMDPFPRSATKCQLQGEFLFAFTPYKGEWAKDFFEKVDVYMFQEEEKSYSHIGEWSLANHFVRSVCGAGDYLVFSFWPFDEEACRAIYESAYNERKLVRMLRAQVEANVKLLEEKNDLNHELVRTKQELEKVGSENQQLRAKNEELSSNVSSLHYSVDSLQQQMRKQINEVRSLSQQLQSERNERWRARDPIHIYVRDRKKDGKKKNDWTFVLDYHKGAHGLALGAEQPDKSRSLYVTVDDDCFEFQLAPAQKLLSLRGLPVVPEQLCPDF